jgi:hypothetical protein
MLGNQQQVLLPLSLSPTSRASLLEGFFDYYYSLFVLFWSRHQHIPNIKCDSRIRFKVALCDGHQKCGRTACAYSDIVDTSIVETGPINIGCPYAPIRHRHHIHDYQKNNMADEIKRKNEELFFVLQFLFTDKNE